MTETKICAQCKQEKPIEDFSKSYKNLCKACVAENERLKRSAKILLPEIPPVSYVPNTRLYVATAAMQGILASGRVAGREAVMIALSYADALIEELKKEKK